MEFEICDTCTKNNFGSNVVPVLNKEISYNDFFRNYMEPNMPCVIKNVTETWEANTDWLIRGNPNLSHLRDKYGSCDVTLYNCGEKYFNSQKTESCKFSTFLDNWGSDTSRSKYLKDWHLKNTFKKDNFYQVPIYFASDWLNEFLTENNEDDYRFVYMGQGGTWTPFHADVFNSYSWSANLCGRKKWVLFPPGEEDSLRDPHGNLLYDISQVYQKSNHFVIIQNPGEAIFVPSGWHHQVWNLEDTISINHNWVNGCNITKMWLAIEENLKSVKKEIADCQDMDDFIGQCQIVLKASFGIDFYKFYNFLEFIAERRLSQVIKEEGFVLFHGHILGVNHSLFDLQTVEVVLRKFLQHEDVPGLFRSEISKIERLLEKLQKIF